MNSNKNAAKIVFLCSGNGGNMKFIHRAARCGLLCGIELTAILADRECGALEFARQNGMAGKVIDYSHDQSELMEALVKVKSDLVISTVHKILVPGITAHFAGKILNLHYSILPSFAGKVGNRPIQDALNYGSCFAGSTVHFVNDVLDGGKPITQSIVPIRKGEDELAVLMETIFRCGCLNLADAIEMVVSQSFCLQHDCFVINKRKCTLAFHTKKIQNYIDILQ